MQGFSFKEKTIIRHNYSWKEQLDFEIKTYANKEEFTFDPQSSSTYSPPDINANPNWKKRKVEIIHGYTFDSPKEALRCEFLKMLELGIKIRKCAVCGKYFIITGHNGKCCDNLYNDTGLTCQQVFSDRNYKNKRKQNPILKEYAKWKEQAKQERDRALTAYNKSPSDSIVNNFKRFLENK